ncbi:DUF2829 domain-containing protein [Halobacillus rhizosphaerae]|uniref:Thoeris anti-defense Tad2 family protein n=1 Tax=Halobacillus rhizosphaerae TaxID=3064889 RepID=UPI00398A963A
MSENITSENGIIESQDFSTALQALKLGKKIKRSHWKGYWFIPKHTAILMDTAVSANGELQVDKAVLMNEMIVAVLKDNGGLVPASPYQEDILANDWIIF